MTDTSAAPAAPQAAPAQAPVTTPAAPASTGAPAAPVAPAAKPQLSPEARAAIVENTKLKLELKKRDEAGKASAADLELLAALRDPKNPKRWEHARSLVPYEEYTNHVLGDLGKKPPEPVVLPPEVEARLKLVDEIEAERKAAKEAGERDTASKAFSDKVTLVTEYITANVETLPMTAALGQGEGFLRAFLAETEQAGGVPPDDADFAARYEKRLADVVEKQLTAIATSTQGKALLQRLLGAPAPTANPKQPEPTAAARSPRTVTNGLSAETPPAKDPRALPEEELRKRSARLLG
jgi:hypothetical protein